MHVGQPNTKRLRRQASPEVHIHDSVVEAVRVSAAIVEVQEEPHHAHLPTDSVSNSL